VKILLISYYFYPKDTVGSIRPSRLADWLLSRGHDVTVVTKMSPPSHLQKTKLFFLVTPDHSFEKKLDEFGVKALIKGLGLSRIINLFSLIFRWPDGQVSWARKVIEKNLVATNFQQYDLIYVSAPPFSSFKIAKELSKAYNIPWVAEFRDLWSENHNYQLPRWRKKIDKYFEKKVLKNASALVTVSQDLAKKLEGFNKPIITIQNGFDLDLLTIKPEIRKKSKVIRLVYTGTIYYQKYSWRELLKGLKKFCISGGFFELILAGSSHEIFLKEAKRLKLDKYVISRGYLKQEESFALQKSADLLIFFPWQGSKGIVTSKLFEYFATRNKIMVVGQRTDISQFIINRGQGHLVSNDNDILLFLKNILLKKDNFQSEIKVDRKCLLKFSRENQFKILEKSLIKLIN